MNNFIVRLGNNFPNSTKDTAVVKEKIIQLFQNILNNTHKQKTKQKIFHKGN